MKTTGLIVLVLMISMQFVSGQKIHVFSDFDKGSIGSLKQVSESKFVGQPTHWIKKDQVGNQYYWFYYGISGVKGKTLTFELNNLTGIYRNSPMDQYTDYTQPVLSYDQEHWVRVTDVSYDDSAKIFNYTIHFTEDTAWVAYAHPYTYEKSREYLKRILQSPYVEMAAEGFSVEKRPINLLKITNENSKKEKKNVMIIALQHGGEDCGGYFTEGVLNFLVSKEKEAKKIRDNFVFYVVPMVNPDGIYHGISRYNVRMEDINSEWDDDLLDTLNLPVEPEALFIKNWTSDFYNAGDSIVFFADVHSQSQKYTNNAYWGNDTTMKALVAMVDKSWKYFHSKGTNEGSASGYFSHRIKTLSSTVELTESYVGDKYYINEDDYRRYGESFVKAIGKFLE